MAESPPRRKTPLIFYRVGPGSEPVHEWLKELPETERQSGGEGFTSSAMAVAGRDAAVPVFGRRIVVDPDQPIHETHGAGTALCLSRASGRAARVYQEDADDAG